MGNKTAIIIEPCKIGSSEHHHLLSTRKTYDYVRKEWSDRNESWCEVTGLEQYFEILKEQYRQATKGQSPQLKEKVRIDKKTGKKKIIQGWSPIREGVVVISDKTTMEDCKRLAESLRLTFGIKTIQIHIDRDEGHYDDKQKWKPNLHAHFVFDWTDGNGKTIKLNDKQISYMQDVCAYNLRMERGEKEGKKHHLDAMSYKLKELEKRVKEKTQQVALLDNAIEENKKLHEENERLKEQVELKKQEVKVAEQKKDFMYEERDKALVELNEERKATANLRKESYSLEKEKNDLQKQITEQLEQDKNELDKREAEIKAIKGQIKAHQRDLEHLTTEIDGTSAFVLKSENEAMIKHIAPIARQEKWAISLKEIFQEVSNRTIAQLWSGLSSIVSGVFRLNNEEIEIKNVELNRWDGYVVAKDVGEEYSSSLSDYVGSKLESRNREVKQDQKREQIKQQIKTKQTTWGGWGKKRGMGI